MALDLVLGLRLGDREVLDHFGEALADGGPVGTRLTRPSMISALVFRAFARLWRVALPMTVSFCRMYASAWRSRAARSSIAMPAFVADGDQRVELLAQSRHEAEHDLLLLCRAFKQRSPCEVFLPRARGCCRRLLGLTVECRQERAGLLEIPSHGLP